MVKEPTKETKIEELRWCYKHDEHKTINKKHAAEQPVALGADHDAARMSRAPGKPTQVLDQQADSPRENETHYRRSILTGKTAYDPNTTSLQQLQRPLRDLFDIEDPDSLYNAWIDSELIGLFNESWFYPYTSLKYHTLLVAALYFNYEKNYQYDDLYLYITDSKTPHQTVYWDPTNQWGLTISGDTIDKPRSKLASTPWRNWSSVWSRLETVPLDTTTRESMVLDAQLRRINSWSTALQYLEDYTRNVGVTIDL